MGRLWKVARRRCSKEESVKTKIALTFNFKETELASGHTFSLAPTNQGILINFDELHLHHKAMILHRLNLVWSVSILENSEIFSLYY